MSYIGNEPIVSATRTVTEVSATAGQTVFTANGGYTVGFIDVFVNGSKLTNSDFTATNGTTITLNEAAQASDIVRLEALGTFLASNGVAKTGDTMTGALLLPDGSASAPALSNDGDSNTGIFFPAADTIAFAEGGTESMRLNSSGNVGIGTTNILKRVSIEDNNSSTTTTTGLSITNFNSTVDSRAGITFRNFDNYGAAIWSRRTGSTAGDLCFGTNNTGGTAETNIVERMRIDSSGRVTTPFQPAFFARPSSDQSTGVVVCNLVDFNIGGHYNSTNGRFTAPVDGRYFFHAITNGGAGINNIALRFRRNGTTVPGFQAYITNEDDSPSIGGIMSLSAGDYVDLATDVTSIAGTPWTSFCGYLVG